MRPFEYTSPTTYDQAVGLLDKSWGKTAILAGGTDLLSLMKDDVVQPERLVNVKKVQTPAAAHAITATAGGLTIGGLNTMAEVADNANVRRLYPTLAEACDNAASPQIRNLATIAGNLCQRPRCWYFRSGFGLLAMKDGKSLVTEGDNRYHAIIANEGPAYFVSPSSIAPVLIAYRATVTIMGANGQRKLALDKFFVIPTKEGEREHALAPNEVVTQIMLPAATGVRAAAYEIRQKANFDWPLASCAVALTMAGANVKTARVVMGHVAPIPWLSEEAADALIGKPVNEQTAEAAAKAAVSVAKPLSKNAYKVQLARVAVKRALLKAATTPERAKTARSGDPGAKGGQA
jgi:xanthine dehydrogenase YagS FAD-binding subunit